MQLKILLCARADVYRRPGGDTVELDCLYQTAVLSGHRVEIATGPRIRPQGFDCLHCFNLTRPLETYSQVRAAARYGVKVFLHPILADLSAYRRMGRRGFPSVLLSRIPDAVEERLRGLWQGLFRGAGWVPALWMFLKSPQWMIASILEHADVALVPTMAEEERLKAFAELRIRRLPPLMDGVSFLRDAAACTQGLPSGLDGYDYGLCIGRIEDLKNQQGIMEAALETGFPFVFAGQINPSHAAYARELIQKAGRHETIHVFPNPSRSLVLSLLKHARFHAQISWCETMGLASLEAALLGQNVIVSKCSDAFELLGEDAIEAHPSSVSEMASAMRQAMQAPRQGRLAHKVQMLTELGPRREILSELWAEFGKA